MAQFGSNDAEKVNSGLISMAAGALLGLACFLGCSALATAAADCAAYPTICKTVVGGLAGRYGTDAIAGANGEPVASPTATGAASEFPRFFSNAAQLEAKFKHAADFGVLESRGASGFEAFGKVVDSFVGDSATVRVMGTYRGSPAILNYNPATAQVVVQAADGAFVSGWQMSPAQLRSVITKASLGGG